MKEEKKNRGSIRKYKAIRLKKKKKEKKGRIHREKESKAESFSLPTSHTCAIRVAYLHLNIPSYSMLNNQLSVQGKLKGKYRAKTQRRKLRNQHHSPCNRMMDGVEKEKKILV